MPSPLQRPALVLNASYEPINICTARRALVLVFKGAARAEEEEEAMVRSRHSSVRLPSVIRLVDYRRIPQRSRVLSRKNILLRDGDCCQYCGTVQHPRVLTVDHIIPRSRGGKNSWDNLVTACIRCNHRKGDRTPQEAGMVLARPPRPFSLSTNRHLMRSLGAAQEKWRPYLFF